MQSCCCDIINRPTLVIHSKTTDYEFLNVFKFMAHSWTMLLKQNLLHNIVLEYYVNNFQYKFVTVGKQININFQKCSQMGFPVIPLGVLRGKAMKKNSKKEKEGELWPPML